MRYRKIHDRHFTRFAFAGRLTGQDGDAVRDLQRKLSALGYPLAIDGIFGQATESAVKAFQRDHGLVADGLAGPGTQAAIDGALPFGDGGWWRRLLQRVKGWFGGTGEN